MTWPSATAPATAPSDHGDVRTQAYYAGGGDYFRSGYYSHGLFTSTALASLGLSTVGRMFLRPFVVPVRRSFDRIGVNVSIAATAASGGLLRLGIYSDSSGFPGSLIVDGGTVSSESTGAKEVTISQSLDPGLCWLGVVSQVSGCTVSAYAAQAVPWGAWTQSSGGSVPPTSLGSLSPRVDGVTGGLPASVTFPSSSVVATPPAISLRAT